MLGTRGRVVGADGRSRYAVLGPTPPWKRPRNRVLHRTIRESNMICERTHQRFSADEINIWKAKSVSASASQFPFVFVIEINSFQSGMQLILFHVVSSKCLCRSTDPLHQQVITRLSQFVSVREPNIRYLGLETMSKIATMGTFESIKQHQVGIFAHYGCHTVLHKFA